MLCVLGRMLNLLPPNVKVCEKLHSVTLTVLSVVDLIFSPRHGASLHNTTIIELHIFYRLVTVNLLKKIFEIVQNIL